MTFIKGLPLMLLTISLGCNAAVQPDRTRIVFNANDKCNFAFFSGLIDAQFWTVQVRPKSPELDAKLLVSC